MVVFITLTTSLHALLFFYDEYILHKSRSLSQKEVNSGLVDGVLFLSTVAMTLFTDYTPKLSFLFIGLSFLSCIAILKHELFLPESISPRESLIHAALYILHPLILYAFYQSWKMNFFATNLTYWMLQLVYFALGFMANIRSLSKTLPIIVVSGTINRSVSVKIKKFNCLDILVKPHDRGRLGEILDSI